MIKLTLVSFIINLFIYVNLFIIFNNDDVISLLLSIFNDFIKKYNNLPFNLING